MSTPPLPFGDAVLAYRRAGWVGTIPLPPRSKTPPPPGWTGYGAPDPSGADIAEWLDAGNSDGNIAIRLPENVIGIDVDHYGSKRGGDTLDGLVRRWGPLPDAPTSTNRDGVSGIRLFAVPPGLAWPDTAGPSIDLIHRGDRYVVCWPSIHPEGRPYRWLDGRIPEVDSLPLLPDAWILGLTGGVVAEHARRVPGCAGAGQEHADAWLRDVRPGSPCRHVAKRLAAFVPEMATTADRHACARAYVLGIVRAGAQGHRGCVDALSAGRRAFRLAVVDEPRRGWRGEWARMVWGAAALVGPVGDAACWCGGGAR